MVSRPIAEEAAPHLYLEPSNNFCHWRVEGPLPSTGADLRLLDDDHIFG